jgi:excisionase family DNA binding protein
VSTKQKSKAAPSAPTPSDSLLNVDEAAAYLGLSEKSVRKRVGDRKIPYIKVGALLRFRREQLDAWLDANSFAPEDE